MTPARILIYGLERMMHEIIENALLGQPDIDVFGPAQRPPAGTFYGLSDAVDKSHPDAVIVGRDDPEFMRTLLERHPRLSLLAVVAGGRETVLYELGVRREELGELTPEALLAAIRESERRWLSCGSHGRKAQLDA
jgi:hypothetical protein